MSPLSSLGKLLLLLAALTLAQCSSTGGHSRADAHGLSSNRLPARVSTGEYVVTLREEATPSALRQLCGQATLREAKSLGHRRYLLRLRPDPGLEALARAADKSGEITAIQPNFRYHALPSLRLTPDR